jgi:alpha-amylase
MRHVSRFSPMLTLTLLGVVLATSCASSTASDERRRPVRRPAEAGPVQWQHDWSNGAVYYQIFVRSFQDSDGDGIGDIRGLISRLDYLNDGDPATTSDLGVDALWLMPMFQSPSYHGYDVVDYETIEEDYGTNEDFQRLLAEAKTRGIRVIVDFVMNHSSSQHPWFVDSASSPAAEKRDWYVWSPTNKGWTQPWGGNYPTWHERNGSWYYGVFWGGMPDLNFTTPAVREEMKRLGETWIRAGVDGFRLDATRYLIETAGGPGQADTAETHAMLREFSAHVRKVNPEAMLVAENWTETPIIATYFGSTETITGGDEMPMNFNFPLSDQILGALNAGNAAPIAAKLDEIRRLYPEGVIDAPFLRNHDQTRTATVLGNDSAKLRSAAAILLTLPGAPFIYYGEEVGMQNGPGSNDEWKRTPMPWNDSGTGGGFTTGTPWYSFAPGRNTANVDAQTGSGSSLLARYRSLIAARRSSEALRKGRLELLTPLTATSSTLAFLRVADGERAIVAHNLTGGFTSAGPYTVSATAIETIWADPGASASGAGSGRISVSLPPRGSGVFRLK